MFRLLASGENKKSEKFSFWLANSWPATPDVLLSLIGKERILKPLVLIDIYLLATSGFNWLFSLPLVFFFSDSRLWRSPPLVFVPYGSRRLASPSDLLLRRRTWTFPLCQSKKGRREKLTFLPGTKPQAPGFMTRSQLLVLFFLFSLQSGPFHLLWLLVFVVSHHLWRSSPAVAIPPRFDLFFSRDKQDKRNRRQLIFIVSLCLTSLAKSLASAVFHP